MVHITSTYILRIKTRHIMSHPSHCLSHRVSQTMLGPQFLAHLGQSPILVFSMYILNKSWVLMQLNFDIVLHSNKHEATNTYLIFQFFLNLYKMPKERCVLNFQDVSSKCSLLNICFFNIFHKEREHSLKPF